MAKRAKLLPHILFLHIGWAREYRGASDDVPVGSFGYLKDGARLGGESLNFKSYKGRCYGYAPRETINTVRLNGAPDTHSVAGILVVWTATDPAQGGPYIVGWYRNACVYATLRKVRPDADLPEVLVEAAATDCHLVPDDERTFYVPSRLPGWPGIASAFFATEVLSIADQKTIVDYVNGGQSSGFSPPRNVGVSKTSAKPGWPSQDPLLRAKVESSAINATTSHYRKLGWQVRSVEKENYGWDLEARKSGRLLRIEVKGRSGSGGVEITPNEYRAMHARLTRMSYRLAIAHDALSTTPTLTIFEYAPASRTWVGPGGLRLAVQEKIGAFANFQA